MEERLTQTGGTGGCGRQKREKDVGATQVLSTKHPTINLYGGLKLTKIAKITINQKYNYCSNESLLLQFLLLPMHHSTTVHNENANVLETKKKKKQSIYKYRHAVQWLKVKSK